MKNIILVTLFIFTYLTAYADGLDRLIRKYKNEKEAVYVNSLQGAILLHEILGDGNVLDINVNGRELNDDTASEIMKGVQTALGITSFRMLVLDDCSYDVKKNFKKELSKAIPNGYELFVKEDGNSMYVKDSDEECYILITAASDDSSYFIEITSNNDFLLSILKGKFVDEE